MKNSSKESSSSKANSSSSKTNQTSNRAKPMIPKAGFTRSGRRSYDYGGKVK